MIFDKFEFRNSKLEIHPPEAGKNTKFKITMFKTEDQCFHLGHLDFCHSFGFRALNFGF